MKIFLTIIVAIAAVSVHGAGLRIGPDLGFILPGKLEGSATYPGPGIYYGGVGIFPLSPIVSAELRVGGALGLGEPWKAEKPGYPSYSGHDADFVTAGCCITGNLAAFSASAGMAYYYIHMDWWQSLTGEESEQKTLEINKLGYNFALGANLSDQINLRMTLHFPEMTHMWAVLSISWTGELGLF